MTFTLKFFGREFPVPSKYQGIATITGLAILLVAGLMALWLFITGAQAIAYYTGIPAVISGIGMLVLTGRFTTSEKGEPREHALLPSQWRTAFTYLFGVVALAYLWQTGAWQFWIVGVCIGYGGSRQLWMRVKANRQ